MIDLDDTGSCPTTSACEGCGIDNHLDLATVETPLGVACITLCASCARGSGFRWTVTYAAIRVGQHCEHLGIDLDQMAASLEVTR